MAGKEIATALQKWIVQDSSTSGFEIPFDFGVDIQTTLYPEVVIGARGAWRVIDTNSNVYNFPRARRFNDADVKYNEVKLGKAMDLELLEGEYDNVNLSHQLSLAKVIQNFEVQSAGADYIRFFIEEAVRQFARAYENWCVTDLLNGGTSMETPAAGAASLLAYQADGKTIDVYKTLLNLRAQMVKNGSNMDNVDLYVTPDIVNKIMEDSHYIANGIGNIPATEVRNGFMGRILGFNVFEAGRFALMTLPAGKEANLIAVDNTQVIKVRHMVQPIVMERAPANFPAECSILKALEYFKNYIVNANGVYYGNLVDIA